MKMKVRILMRLDFMDIPKPMMKKMEKLFKQIESRPSTNGKKDIVVSVEAEK